MSDTQKHTKPNVPDLRFPGFEGEWARCTLGEIGEPYIGLTYSPADVVNEGGTIVFRSSNIQNGEIDYSDIVRVNKKIKDSIITRKDDLLICARNGSPRLIGKNALLKDADAGQTFGAFMLVFRSNDNHFVHQLLSTKGYYSQVSENLGARINQITTSNIKDFEFYFPKSIAERNKIAVFLNLIDERISIQNKVIERYQSLIRAIIQDSQQKTTDRIYLRDILTERKELNANGYQICSVSVIRGIVNQVEYLGRSFAAKETSHYHVVRKGDIVYTKSPTGAFPFGIIKQSSIESPVAVSPLYGVYEPKSFEIGQYLHYYFCSHENALNYLHPLIQKGAKNTINITNQHFLDNKVSIPCKPVLKTTVAAIMFLANRCSIEEETHYLYSKQKEYFLKNLFI